MAFVLLGLEEHGPSAFGILRSFINLAVQNKSYGQASFRKSIFPTAQMPGR
jgi:hypothetical protein